MTKHNDNNNNNDKKIVIAIIKIRRIMIRIIITMIPITTITSRKGGWRQLGPPRGQRRHAVMARCGLPAF